MKHLLLISCSKRKSKEGWRIPAIERYDGPVFQCLRKMMREGIYPINTSCLIISAKYGLITTQDLIETYNEKMSPIRAIKLQTEVQYRLSRHITNQTEQIFINLGKDYMLTLEGFNWKTYYTLEASGGIGMRTSQMKHWLLNSQQHEENPNEQTKGSSTPFRQ